MAWTNIVDHQNVNISNGTNIVGPVNMADGINSIRLRVARCTTATPTIWPDPATTLTAKISVSYDGGANWEFQSSVNNAVGGIAVGESGEIPEIITIVSGLKPIANRQIRTELVVASGPLRSEVSVDVE